MKHLVIGLGEVGQAIQKVFDADGLDTYKDIIPDSKVYSYMHICFPYSADFIDQVKEYVQEYSPAVVIIHSTVPVGTSRKCGALHSPIIGIHPHLEEGVRTFVKYIGGEQASDVADIFRRVGLKIQIFDSQETTELMKILDTTFYGVCLEYTKDVKRLCKQFGVPFEAWTIWTSNYNEGYTKLGHSEYVRPNLVPIMKKLGGHCIGPNAELLNTKFTRFLKESNEE